MENFTCTVKFQDKIGRPTIETRKCPEVQSFALNADELWRIRGAENTLVAVGQVGAIVSNPVPAE